MSRSVNSADSFESDTRPPPSAGSARNSDLSFVDGGPSMQSSTQSLQNGVQQAEWTRQFKQLNLPIDSPAVISGMLHTGDDMFRSEGRDAGTVTRADSSMTSGSPSILELNAADSVVGSSSTADSNRPPASGRKASQRRSKADHPHPRLRRQPLIESYVNQFVASGSWTAAEGEKGYSLTRTLTKILSEAEMLSESKFRIQRSDRTCIVDPATAVLFHSDPPPLSLSIHLTHLLLLYLLAIPAQLMPVLGKWTVPVALVAGWGLLGVEALSREVGAVFGTSGMH
ncbi:hypothetical protein QFC19_002591 [Naganishia cerealis]|uniref:Uncharacterized protein n=1 Tax=Naganishia cerealis TaxID=610337 RepID=A0ACC2WA72_9TREE|nr:hypothetical protein QFC19_002591 [Naganishia cerealis]